MHTMEEEQILRKVEWRLWVELPQMNLDIPAQEVAIRRDILLDYVEENIKELLEAAAIPVVQRNRYTVVHKGFLLLLFSLFGFNGSRELIGLGNAINDDLHFWVYGARGNGRWNKYRTAFYDFIRKLKERKDVFRVQKGVPDSQHASGMYKTYYSYVLDCYLQSVNKDHVVYYYDRVYSFKRGYWQAGSMRTGPKRLSDPYVVLATIQNSQRIISTISMMLKPYRRYSHFRTLVYKRLLQTTIVFYSRILYLRCNSLDRSLMERTTTNESAPSGR